MFRAAKMQKFRIIFPQRVHDRVIARLHETGVAQLREISGLDVKHKAFGEEIHELPSILAKFREMEEFVGQPPAKPAVAKELTLVQTLKLAKKSLNKIEPRVIRLKEKSESLDKKRRKMLAQIETLEKFRGVEVPLRYLHSTDKIKISVGRVPAEKTKEFFREAKEVTFQRVFAWAVETGEKNIVILACRTEDHRKLSPILYRYEVEELELPSFRESPTAAMDKIKKKLVMLEKLQKNLEKSVKKLARSSAREISQMRELLEIQYERVQASGLFGYTDATTIVEGWVPEKRAKKLEHSINTTTQGRYIFRIYEPQRAEAETVPIQLENPKMVEDFEYVTKMYALPKYDEVDPTPVMSFTFPLFFAIALSDAGYGIALGLFMASGIWLARIFPSKLRRMMVVCAVFTVIVGILVGGWFGFGHGLWVNPIQQPIPLLKLVIFIGIIHLILALGLTGVLKDIVRRDWKNILFNRVSRMLILIGFFGLSFCILSISLYEFGINFTFPKMGLFAAFNPLAPANAVVSMFRALFYLGLAIGIAGAVATGKGAGGKIGGPIDVVYGITGLISDVTSYSRLLALGIATGIIAFSINFIIGFAWQGVMPTEFTPISVIYAAVLLIAFGFIFVAAHSFNIFINSLGGFIHTMRLHFAEFFGKFYEGGGEEFSPFKAKRRFTKVKGGEGLGR
ncbi:MAG TPA: V-type ATP synthase subunit I [Hadesarchaea archaeon]|nr:V-type ATP synthase subunit I [Hadesarchaea archaeon]